MKLRVFCSLGVGRDREDTGVSAESRSHLSLPLPQTPLQSDLWGVSELSGWGGGWGGSISTIGRLSPPNSPYPL